MTTVRSHDSNLLVALNRWAFRQNENFVTEALVFLLKFLFQEEPYIGIKLFYNFTGAFFGSSPRHGGIARKMDIQ